MPLCIGQRRIYSIRVNSTGGYELVALDLVTGRELYQTTFIEAPVSDDRPPLEARERRRLFQVLQTKRGELVVRLRSTRIFRRDIRHDRLSIIDGATGMLLQELDSGVNYDTAVVTQIDDCSFALVDKNRFQPYLRPHIYTATDLRFPREDFAAKTGVSLPTGVLMFSRMFTLQSSGNGSHSSGREEGEGEKAERSERRNENENEGQENSSKGKNISKPPRGSGLFGLTSIRLLCLDPLRNELCLPPSLTHAFGLSFYHPPHVIVFKKLAGCEDTLLSSGLKIDAIYYDSYHERPTSITLPPLSEKLGKRRAGAAMTKEAEQVLVALRNAPIRETVVERSLRRPLANEPLEPDICRVEYVNDRTVLIQKRKEVRGNKSHETLLFDFVRRQSHAEAA
jgi:hypothetical protein